MSVSKERLQIGQNKEGIAFQRINAEPSIWNVLDFNVIKGDPKKFVKGYTNLVITQKVQQQYFAHENPIGKILYTQPEYGQPQPCLITGVIAGIPQNTHLHADIITIAAYAASQNDLPQKNQGYFFCPQYLLLKHGTSVNNFTAKINNWYAKQSNVPAYAFKLQNIKDVYLRSDFDQFREVRGSITNVYILLEWPRCCSL